ncbi:MAG: NTP transferase domain-containing protein [Blastocatellia bacterium]|nr:NTP transferase domain-containing protein [Blastocatellia bacterium]MCX7753331.1 NTP transferase domain-containing protein [Blastocatellia bacterium]MDW8168106.1 NTP transferase domain-containing protein [Acidobacteriota bacterium]
MVIDGILLAAGLSRRFGRPKQLAEWRGKPLVAHVAETALASRLRHVIVVLGYAAHDVRRALASLLRDPRLRIVFNAEYEEGQASSIRRGLRALEPGAEAAMFLTCDQPLLTPSMLNALIDAFAAHRPLICYPVHEGVRGSPVIFSAELFPELMALSGDVGGRVLIEKYRARVHEQKIPSARPLADVDTPADLLALDSESDPLCGFGEESNVPPTSERSRAAPREFQQSLLPFPDREEDRADVLIVCDGSSQRLSSGERRAAAAAIVKRGAEMAIYGEYLGAATNQQAEIVAACLGLEALAQPARVRLITDSQYVVRTMRGIYKRRANLAFWDRLERAAKPHEVIWTWMRGHAGHPLQEICDRAARLIAREGRVDSEKLLALLDRHSPKPVSDETP